MPEDEKRTDHEPAHEKEQTAEIIPPQTAPESEPSDPEDAEMPDENVPGATAVGEVPPAPGPAPVIGTTTDKKKPGLGVKVALAAIAIGAILLVAAFVTLTVATTPASTSASFPFKVTYDVLFPSSDPVHIGGYKITAIPVGDQVAISINGNSELWNTSEEHVLSAQHATISSLGVSVTDFDFKINAIYRGKVGDRADFYLEFQTSRQVPNFLIDRLLPAEVNARPV
jgi:hypothetical protein